MLEFKYDTQLLIDGDDLDEDEVYDYFVDNFKRAQAELGGFTKALSATLSSIFSWQTALLVLLTVLPKIAKAIHDKKKAQEEANKETEKAITYDEMMANAYRASEQEQIKALRNHAYKRGSRSFDVLLYRQSVELTNKKSRTDRDNSNTYYHNQAR